MQTQKIWDLWDVDTLSLPKADKIELLKNLHAKGLFTWDLELDFEVLIVAYQRAYQEESAFHFSDYELNWRRCILLENVPDKRVSLRNYLEKITGEEIISLFLAVHNSKLFSLVLESLAKRIVLGSVDYEETISSITEAIQMLPNIRLDIFFRYLWGAEIQYRGGGAGSLQEIFSRAQALHVEKMCINYPKLKFYGTLEELQHYNSHYNPLANFIDLYESYVVGGRPRLQIYITYLSQLNVSVESVILTAERTQSSTLNEKLAQFYTLLAEYTDGSFVKKLTNPVLVSFFSAYYSQV